jgi:5-methylcytosine-specific restriction endonuclease McrA
LKGICKNCKFEFSYYPSASKGLFCSNRCQGDYLIIKNYESGKRTWKTSRGYFKIKTEYKCAECGISEWNNRPLTLQVDHIDGDRVNNEMDNLRYLCPNCHTQTDTWGVKNISKNGRERLVTNKKQDF